MDSQCVNCGKWQWEHYRVGGKLKCWLKCPLCGGEVVRMGPEYFCTKGCSKLDIQGKIVGAHDYKVDPDEGIGDPERD